MHRFRAGWLMIAPATDSGKVTATVRLHPNERVLSSWHGFIPDPVFALSALKPLKLAGWFEIPLDSGEEGFDQLLQQCRDAARHQRGRRRAMVIASPFSEAYPLDHSLVKSIVNRLVRAEQPVGMSCRLSLPRRPEPAQSVCGLRPRSESAAG